MPMNWLLQILLYIADLRLTPPPHTHTVCHLETREESFGVIQFFPVLGNAEAAAGDGECALPSSNGFQVGEILGSDHGI